MTRVRSTSIALVLALTAIVGVWLAPTASSVEPAGTCPPGAVICGVVTDAGGPVPGILVALFSQAYPPVPGANASTTTAADGTWSLSPAALGNPYILGLSDPTMTYLSRSTANLVLDPASPQFVTTVLVLPGRVTGTVTAADDGSPVFTLKVRLYDATTGKQVGGGVHNVVPTDSTGHYDFGPVPAGTYHVLFGPDAFSPFAGSYALQWNGGTPTIGSSPVLDVQPAGAVVADASMVSAGSISGQITGHDGSLLPADTTIRLYNDVTGVVTKVRASNAFRFDHLAPGSYHLRYGDGIFVPPVWFGQVPDRASSTAVIVTAGSTAVADASFLT